MPTPDPSSATAQMRAWAQRIQAGDRAARDGVAGLPAEEREVVERRAAGEGWAEIAAALGGTAAGRRMQLKRALDRVAPELGLEGEEGPDDA
jgi:hypothetical protein